MRAYAIRVLSGAVCASVTLIGGLIAHRAGIAGPGEGIVHVLYGLGFLICILGYLAVHFSETLAPRYTVSLRGLRFRARRLDASLLLCAALASWGVGGLFAYLAGIVGARRQGPAMWLVIAGIAAWMIGYLLAQRRWKRSVLIGPTEVSAHTGEESVTLQWSDIVSVALSQPTPAGTKYMTKANAAMHAEISIGLRPEARRPEDGKYGAFTLPVGDLAVPNGRLVTLLQHLLAYPADRVVLTDEAEVPLFLAHLAGPRSA
ncbi:hypothetical protein [Corynebacterium sp.]|uniref:hypothetical protein n=1 Tax=Corynebacterium sp. TaxID=1720 RepID=UPI0026DF3DF3|nr:hypothetical protein [Corynebacterium sp.]MDO5512692.1 hypothetical protein [Corynebacterium sp.]